jgi:hypothetical protein
VSIADETGERLGTTRVTTIRGERTAWTYGSLGGVPGAASLTAAGLTASLDEEVCRVVVSTASCGAPTGASVTAQHAVRVENFEGALVIAPGATGRLGGADVTIVAASEHHFEGDCGGPRPEPSITLEVRRGYMPPSEIPECDAMEPITARNFHLLPSGGATVVAVERTGVTVTSDATGETFAIPSAADLTTRLATGSRIELASAFAGGGTALVVRGDTFDWTLAELHLPLGTEYAFALAGVTFLVHDPLCTATVGATICDSGTGGDIVATDYGVTAGGVRLEPGTSARTDLGTVALDFAREQSSTGDCGGLVLGVSVAAEVVVDR